MELMDASIWTFSFSFLLMTTGVISSSLLLLKGGREGRRGGREGGRGEGGREGRGREGGKGREERSVRTALY
jgi:hypothetical protein